MPCPGARACAPLEQIRNAGPETAAHESTGAVCGRADRRACLCPALGQHFRGSRPLRRRANRAGARRGRVREPCRTLPARRSIPESDRHAPTWVRQRRIQIFTYPLPELIDGLRAALYERLAPIANRWTERMGMRTRYPENQATFLRKCHAAGQRRPTPLLLKYEAGDYNCLHQDLYGELAFPLQTTFLLSQPGRDFTGGEFLLTEQRPRMQSRAEVVPLACGEAVIFAVHHRPVAGSRGSFRVNMRHGVSRLRSGKRYTLGVIFHDAK